MSRKKYDTVADALKDIKPGGYRHVRVKDSIVTLRKQVDPTPTGLTANLYTPSKRAKVITK